MYEYLFVYIFKSFTFIFINIIHIKGQNKVVFTFINHLFINVKYDYLPYSR